MRNKVLEKAERESTAESAIDRAVVRSLEARREAYTAEVRSLVEAAFALIRESGELDPRVSTIVGRAGLSNQAFYKHFRSKDELLVAVLDEGGRILAGYLEHRMQRAASPGDAVREWLRGMAEQALDAGAAEATRPFALARGRLADTHAEEVAASERQLEAPLRAAIADGVASGEFPHADPERDAESLYHLAMGWLQARLVESSAPLRADAARLEAFALAGLARGRG